MGLGCREGTSTKPRRFQSPCSEKGVAWGRRTGGRWGRSDLPCSLARRRHAGGDVITGMGLQGHQSPSVGVDGQGTLSVAATPHWPKRCGLCSVGPTVSGDEEPICLRSSGEGGGSGSRGSPERSPWPSTHRHETRRHVPRQETRRAGRTRARRPCAGRVHTRAPCRQGGSRPPEAPCKNPFSQTRVVRGRKTSCGGSGGLGREGHRGSTLSFQTPPATADPASGPAQRQTHGLHTKPLDLQPGQQGLRTQTRRLGKLLSPHGDASTHPCLSCLTCKVTAPGP